MKYFSYLITSKPSDTNAASKGTVGITFIEKDLYMVVFNHVGTNANVVLNEKRLLKSMAIGILMSTYKSQVLTYYNQDGSLTYEGLIPGGVFRTIQAFPYPILTHIDDSINIKTFILMNMGPTSGSGMIYIGDELIS